MKKIILSLTLLQFVLTSFSQPPTLTKDYYFKKSKNQYTAGWVFLGGGVAMTTIGIILGSNHTSNYGTLGSPNFDIVPASAVLGIAGIGAALVSIPFFISSSKNARKAATISFNNQNILMLQQNSFVSKMQPTITLKISL